MKQENRQIFEENLQHYWTLERAGYMVHLSNRDRSNLVRAMSEEFQPGYTADLWCPPCVANMMRQVYRRYLAWKDEEQKQRLAALTLPDSSMVNEPDNIHASADAIVEVFSELFPAPDEIEPEQPDPLPNEPEVKAETPVQTKANFPSHKQNHRRR